MTYERIEMTDPLYAQERELRNRVLLRPIGIPDFGWEMFDTKSAHFVAIDDDRVVGCALLNIHDEGPTNGRLMQMAVDGQWQGQGVGKRLVEVLCVHGSQIGLHEITCHARTVVADFYRKLGFEAYGQPFLEAEVEHLHMRIKLTR